jgi:hypothetical protein
VRQEPAATSALARDDNLTAALTPFVVRAVRLHANTHRLRATVPTLQADHCRGLRALRLLDLVAQSNSASPALPEGWAFPGAHHFAHAVRTCPLRLVLADDLTECTTRLAYAEGERLSGCLDLIHVPSQQLWLEWPEAIRQASLSEIPACARTACSNVRRSGVLISADAAGRAGSVRTFWSTQTDQVYSAALITDFDLDRAIRPALDVDAVFGGAPFGVVMPVEAAVDELLSHVSFRLDPAWAAYYRAADLSQGQRSLILHEVLGTMAFDMPMILALFLLFAAKDGLRRQVADLERLNRARCRSGKHALLDHVEVRSSIALGHVPAATANANANRRRGPRLHHVRGHIARRGDKVYWRIPHLRGSAHQGVVQTRTVQLSFR